MSGKRSLPKIPRGVSFGGLKTWIEIDQKNAKQNIAFFRERLAPHTNLWAVVKSNAYGHGIFVFSRLLNRLGIDGFCVDSPIEGMKLRRAGIRKPILVLGATLPQLLKSARKENIILTISNFEALKGVLKEKTPPQFHIKIDTGMHRQGFYLKDIPQILKMLKTSSRPHSSLRGLYTHFAAAKDIHYPTYTELQFQKFLAGRTLFAHAGYPHLLSHVSATGGALLGPRYHLDAVRVGIGLYGLWPSPELEAHYASLPSRSLAPVLRWRTVVSEVKFLEAGDFIGYDLTERVPQRTRMAILPIGYWHGFPRSLSGIGRVIVNGKMAKVLGRVSMDLVAVDIGKTLCAPGTVATIIGRDGAAELLASDVARVSGTTHYEFLTRLNPLVERVVV